MTTGNALPRFTYRQEGDGYVVYLPDTGTYLFANPAAQLLLTELQTGQSGEEIHQLVEVLRGTRPRVISDDTTAPRLVPLAEVIGSSADRCETFGMPL